MEVEEGKVEEATIKQEGGEDGGDGEDTPRVRWEVEGALGLIISKPEDSE